MYDPERWLDPERSRGVTTNPAIFVPFSAGPRTVSLAAFPADFLSAALIPLFVSAWDKIMH